MRDAVARLIVLLFPTLVNAGPVGMARMDPLVERASLIVVGEVVQGSQSGPNAAVVLAVRRTLKGEPRGSRVAVSAVVAEEHAGQRDLRGMRGVWFLREEEAGGYGLMPVMVGSVPLEFCVLPAMAELPASWVGPASASALERVLREVAAGAESGLGGSPLFLELLAQAEAGSGMRGVHRRMRESSSAAVSMAGVAGLVRSGDAEALVALPARLQGGGAETGPSLAQAVCEYFNGNAAGLRILGELAGKRQAIPRLRQCAAFALRSIHSRESLPFLAALLDSDDGEVRYEGVAGLASYANSGLVPGERPLTVDGVVQPRHAGQARTAATEANFPTLETFRKDERSVVEFWRQWAREHAAAQ